MAIVFDKLLASIDKADLADKVEQLRTLIYEYIQENPDNLDIDDVQARIASPEKVERFVDNPKVIYDWMLKRFLLSAKIPFDIESAFDKFLEIYKFRSKHQISKLTRENTLPQEFYSLGIYIADTSMKDREGNRLFIVRLKHYKKLPQLDVLIKRALIYILELHDLEFERGQYSGVALLVDLQDFDYRNINLDLMQFCIKLGFIFAGPFKSILVYDLHWAFTFLFRMAESWVNLALGYNLDIFHMVDRNSLKDYVDKELLPTFLSGTKDIDLSAPSTAKPFNEFIESLGDLIEEENVLKIAQYLQEIIM